MKMMRLLWPLYGILLAVCLLQTGAGISYASTPTVPIVTIQATDPSATWSGNPGVFTVFRQGYLWEPVTVYYQISGTALNGMDYQMIATDRVQIPPARFPWTL